MERTTNNVSNFTANRNEIRVPDPPDGRVRRSFTARNSIKNRVVAKKTEATLRGFFPGGKTIKVGAAFDEMIRRGCFRAVWKRVVINEHKIEVLPQAEKPPVVVNQIRAHIKEEIVRPAVNAAIINASLGQQINRKTEVLPQAQEPPVVVGKVGKIGDLPQARRPTVVAKTISAERVQIYKHLSVLNSDAINEIVLKTSVRVEHEHFCDLCERRACSYYFKQEQTWGRYEPDMSSFRCGVHRGSAGKVRPCTSEEIKCSPFAMSCGKQAYLVKDRINIDGRPERQWFKIDFENQAVSANDSHHGDFEEVQIQTEWALNPFCYPWFLALAKYKVLKSRPIHTVSTDDVPGNKQRPTHTVDMNDVPGNRQRTNPEDVMLGGDNDCWRKIFTFKMSTTYGFQLADASKARNARKEMIAMKEPINLQEMVDYAWNPDSLIGCPKIHPKKILEKMPEFIKRHWVLFVCTGENKLHVEDAKIQDDYPGEGFFNLYEVVTDLDSFIKSFQIVKPVEIVEEVLSPQCSHDEDDKENCNPFDGHMRIIEPKCGEEVIYLIDTNVIIGSSKEMIDTAMNVLQTELAKSKAQQQFDSDYASILKVNVRMGTAEMKSFEKYVGNQVLSTQQVVSTNDHKFIAGARSLVRRQLIDLHPHNKSAVDVLHIGSTFHEIRTWWKYTAHDFYIAVKDSKDISRIYTEAIDWVASQIRNAELPAFSTKSKVLKATFSSLETLLEFACSGERKRIFISSFPDRHYAELMFEDCQYRMSEPEIQDMFRKTQAKVGYGIMFVPDFLVTEDCYSALYNYERYLPMELEVREFVRKVWPACLVVTPVVNFHFLGEIIDKCVQWSFREGPKLAKKIWETWTTDDYPYLAFLSSALDVAKLKPIVQALFKNIWPLVYDRFSRVRIAWKDGVSNGYDEQWIYWKNWLKPRIRSSDFCLDSEVISHFGEMYLKKYYVTDGADSIVTQMSLPPSRQIVWVADIEASYDRNLGAINSFTYFPMNANDWMRILNWALDQPYESLTFSTMQTTVNRISRGLELGSRKLVDEMSIPLRQIPAVALAALMEAYNRLNIISEIENDDQLKDAYTRNIGVFLKDALRVGITVATGGLSIPAYFLVKWLFSSVKSCEFVKYPSEPKMKTTFGKRIKGKDPLQEPIPVIIPLVEQDAVKTDCICCDLYKVGAFSTNGAPEDGQLFHVHSHNDPAFKFRANASETAEALLKVRESEGFHSTTKAAPVIRTFKHWLESNSNGVEADFKLDYLMGGPGTGKSFILRVLAKYFEEQAMTVNIVVPFADLTKDYTACEINGYPGRHLLNVNTTWYATRDGTADVMIVDEISGVDWQILMMQAAFLGVKHVIVAGDNLQGGIRPEANEGSNMFHILSASGDLNKIRCHELVKNYRLDAWRVKLANEVYKYKMIATRNDMLPPKFITVEEYRKMTFDMTKHREMVFRHDSAELVFGSTSTAGSRDPAIKNLSVRSSQGKTCTTAAIALTDQDMGFLDMPGLLNVAGTRSTHQTYFVLVASVDDPVAMHAKKLTFTDKDESIERIANKPWPIHAKEEQARPLNLRQQNMLRELNKIRQGVHSAKLEEDNQRFLLDKVEYQIDETNVPYIPEDWIWDKFNICLFEPLIKRKPEFKEKITAYLINLWWDDDRMGRKGMIGNFLEYFGSGKPALGEFEGKKMIPVDDALRLYDLSGLRVMAYKKGGNSFYESPNVQNYGVDVFLMFDNGHIQEVEPKKVSMISDGVVVKVNPYMLVHNQGTPGPGIVKNLPKDRQGNHIYKTPVGVKKPNSSPYQDVFNMIKDNYYPEYVKDILEGNANPLPPKPVKPIRKFVTKPLVGKDHDVKAMRPTTGKVDADFIANLLMTVPIAEDLPQVEKPPVVVSNPLDEAKEIPDEELNKILEESRAVEFESADEDSTDEESEGIKTPPEDLPDLETEEDRQKARIDRYNKDMDRYRELCEELLNSDGPVIGEIPAEAGSLFFGPSKEEKPKPYLQPYWKKIHPAVYSSTEHRVETNNRSTLLSTRSFDPKPPDDIEPHAKGKLRFGTNVYLMRDLIDPSGAYPENQLNFAKPFAGLDEDVNVDVNPTSFFWSKTKAGKLRRLPKKKWWQINPGMANHFGDHPIENLQAVRRYATKNVQPKRRTAESDAWCREIVDEAFRDKWLQEYVLPIEEQNFIVDGAQKAAQQRNYWKRGLEHRKRWLLYSLTFSGKQQRKPMKDGKLNLEKTGQGIMQSPPDFNNEWIGWARLVNFVLKDRAKPHLFMDDREKESNFRTRLTESIRKLPKGCQVAILDAEEYDSKQGPVTVYIEQLIMEKLGFHPLDIKDFQEIRKPAKFIAHGQFAGHHFGQKGSGFLDTKSMNTALELVVSNRMFTGVGPKVEAAKGDDYLRVQSGLSVNETEVNKVHNYTGLNFKAGVGRGGEFIGCSVSAEGMYPSATRVAMKAISDHVRDEKHLQEKQISWRNTVNEWKLTGLHELVNYGAYAQGESPNYVEACVAFVDSISHITWKQFKQIAKPCWTPPFSMPSHEGGFLNGF